MLVIADAVITRVQDFSTPTNSKTGSEYSRQIGHFLRYTSFAEVESVTHMKLVLLLPDLDPLELSLSAKQGHGPIARRVFISLTSTAVEPV